MEDQVENQTNNEQKLFKKLVVWENTHNFVHSKKGIYKGIKTGITNTAGPCLSSFVEYDGKQLIIIVLNCKNMKQRFKDNENLRKWAFEQLYLTLN